MVPSAGLYERDVTKMKNMQRGTGNRRPRYSGYPHKKIKMANGTANDKKWDWEGGVRCRSQTAWTGGKYP